MGFWHRIVAGVKNDPFLEGVFKKHPVFFICFFAFELLFYAPSLMGKYVKRKIVKLFDWLNSRAQ